MASVDPLADTLREVGERVDVIGIEPELDAGVSQDIGGGEHGLLAAASVTDEKARRHQALELRRARADVIAAPRWVAWPVDVAMAVGVGLVTRREIDCVLLHRSRPSSVILVRSDDRTTTNGYALMVVGVGARVGRVSRLSLNACGKGRSL